ncbi:hypothetical protein [Nannocystis pusilla]|uniref:Uncharacterized protein n=1 Tax=Nannocystis pusilla TaxID=889268 RepID=A0ABS7U1D3_9BACT|nr:hypothetical protein [Nannocystis pusilla]MBZ5714246.1 hypothetical protein [Nannocystis pusilla]
MPLQRLPAYCESSHQDRRESSIEAVESATVAAEFVAACGPAASPPIRHKASIAGPAAALSTVASACTLGGIMRRLLERAREFGVATAAAAALLGLGTLVTYLSGSLLAGGFTTLVLGVPRVLTGVWGCVGLVVAATLAFLGGVPLGEYGGVARGEQGALSLPEAARHPELVRLAVGDARVDASRLAKAYHQHGSGKSFSSHQPAIAPIVPSSWRPDDPVHVYAACHDLSFDDRGCRDAWAAATDTLVRVPADDKPCYRELVPPGANLDELAFVYWDRPERYLGVLWTEWATALRVTAIAWLAIGALALVGQAVAARGKS